MGPGKVSLLLLCFFCFLIFRLILISLAIILLFGVAKLPDYNIFVKVNGPKRIKCALEAERNFFAQFRCPKYFGR